LFPSIGKKALNLVSKLSRRNNILPDTGHGALITKDASMRATNVGKKKRNDQGSLALYRPWVVGFLDLKYSINYRNISF
jgi:hypothetical protein